MKMKEEDELGDGAIPLIIGTVTGLESKYGKANLIVRV
jgi:hypothetical protein